jgi:apolipoprotein N-acyltransferase
LSTRSTAALRIVLSALAGVLFALAFPDASIPWLIFVSFIPLFLALAHARRGWHAFALGWLSQTVAWMLMVPWVIRVMSHYGGLPYTTGVLLYLAMCLYLGMYGGLFGLLVHWIHPASSFRRWLFVPLAWAAVEYIRTYLFTGFPWNLVAASIVDYTSLIQFDRVAGPYAMSMLILLPATTICWYTIARPTGVRRLLLVGGTIIILFVWWATGLVAAKLIARPTGTPEMTAALLQPNISQEMRWSSESLVAIFQRMMTMTDDAVRHHVNVVIWPESTVPLSYSSTDFYREQIESTSRAANVDIILGSVAEDPTQPAKLWNAAFLVSNGRTIGHYDKIRLVPFGEYVPLRKLLFFAEKLVHAVGEFEFGTKDTPLVGRFHYGPAICYEIVYPQIARSQVQHGADVLVTITNDAWYDGTSAPRQHLNQARLRAIETDRYLLRSGTTGISALVDPTGRLLREIPMGQQGIIYANFHPRTTITPYVRLGDWFAWFACAAVMIAVFRGRRAKRTLA